MQRLRKLWPYALACALGLLVVVWGITRNSQDWDAPREVKDLKNPVPPSQAALDAAKEIYLDKCAKCHGDEGKGDGPEAAMYSVRPADFTNARRMNEITDGEIFWRITKGRRPMPSYERQLNEEQRWQLVHFLRTFAQRR